MKAKTAIRNFTKSIEKIAPKSLEQMLARAHEICQQLDSVRDLYKERDKLIAELVKNKAFLASKGVVAVDGFKGRPYVVKPCVISRWTLEFPKAKAGKA